MKNSSEIGESGQMTQQQDIGFHLPPPYSVGNAAIVYNPNNPSLSVAHSNWIPNNANGTSLDLFNQTLGNNNRFTFSPVGSLGFTTRTIIVQIRDTAQRPLISIMTIPGRNISRGAGNDHSIRIGSVIQMSNSSGQILLTGTENGQSITVSSGENVLGVVEGNMLCSTSLTTRGIMGEILFQSIGGTEMNRISSGGCCGSIPSEFTLVSNGVALARIERSTDNSADCVVSLLNSQHFDLRTKALIIFTGYLIYYGFLAETTFGKIGARGLAKRLFMYICIFFVVVMILFISIPIIVITTRS